jgi:hypothetical protein
MVPEKVGLKGVTREGMDYEFTVVIDIDIKHNASASKDRTQLFAGKPEFRITADTGSKILEWCNSGLAIQEPSPAFEVPMEEQIQGCPSMQELVSLYNQQSKEVQESYKLVFATKRDELQKPHPDTNPISHISKAQQNGATAITN